MAVMSQLTKLLFMYFYTNWTHMFLMAVLCCCLFEHLRRTKNPKADKPLPPCLPPGPKSWPVIGNLAQLGRTPHATLTEWSKRYGDVYSMRMGSWPTVVLNGITIIKQAMVKQAEDFSGRPDFYSFKFLADGKSMGFADYGPRWKLHRRIAQNALAMFINKKDDPLENAVLEEARVLVQNLQNGENGIVDPHDEVFLSVGNIICALCFGKRYRREDDEFKMLVKNNDEFMAFVGAGNPVDIMPWMRHFTRRSFKGFLKILATMSSFVNKKQREHYKTYNPENIRDVTDALIKLASQTPVKEKEAVGLTDEHIMITVQEMIGAGFDTIATTLHWSILFMATHPHVQKLVQKEIDANVPRDRLPRYTDMETMPYTEACILETMRHSCIFPFALPHSTTQDTHLNGYLIPSKTLVFVNLWSVTRDETYFPEPEKFDPSRFLTSEGTMNKLMVENMLPYGTGRRRCPGELLARMEIFVFFASLLQQCSFATISGVTYSLKSKYGLTLKPQDYKVSVVSRM